MKEYNQELLNFIYRICEKDGTITNVGPEYYNDFLNIPPKFMETLIKCIVCNRSDAINKQIFSKKWEKDEELYQYIMDFLDMMAHGILGVRGKDGKLVVQKPVGPWPNAETEKKIDQKIHSAIPLIKKVILRSVKGITGDNSDRF